MTAAHALCCSGLWSEEPRPNPTLSRRPGADGVWKWHTWLSFYAVAGSFALLGPTTLAARLPFALFGLLTVWLTGVAGLVLYRRLGPGRRAPAWGLFLVATLLFHTHYVYAATLLATLLLHAGWLDRGRLRQTLWISTAVTGCALPWIGWVSSIQLSEAKTARLLELGDTLGQTLHYLRLLLEVLPANGWFLLIPLLLLVVRRWRPDRLPACRASNRRSPPPPSSPSWPSDRSRTSSASCATTTTAPSKASSTS